MDATLPLFDEYKVDLEAFEGPLDLLLHLIRREEVDVYDIPIGRIAEEYLAYVGRMRALDIDVAGEFAVMAATLMVIKSRMLLPQEGGTQGEDEGEEEGDPRLDLVRQLVEYKRFKDAAEVFGVREFLRGAMYGRGGRGEGEALGAEEGVGKRLGDLGVEELFEAFRRVLARAEETVSFGHLKMQRWSVPDKMAAILARVGEPGAGEVSFGALVAEGAPKGEVIVTFVALLELLRLRHVRVEQGEVFGEIRVVPVPEGEADAHLPLPSFDELRY